MKKYLKQLLALSVALILCVSMIELPAKAVTRCENIPGTNLTFTLDSYNQKLTISGSGPMKNYDSLEDAPWVSQISAGSLKEIVIEEGVSTIGTNCFVDTEEHLYAGVRECILPSTLTSTPPDAFSGLFNSVTFYVGCGLSAFNGYAFSGIGNSDLVHSTIICTETSVGDLSALNPDSSYFRGGNFTTKKISIAFYEDSESGTPTVKTYEAGKNITDLPTPEPRDGYTFDGWYTSNGEKFDNYVDSVSTKLYGHWSTPTHTHTWNVGGERSDKSFVGIYAQCTNSDLSNQCDYQKSDNKYLRYRVTFTNATYTGNAYNMYIITGTDEWVEKGFQTPTLTFEGTGSTKYPESETPPTNVGTYAIILEAATPDNTFVTVDSTFEITKATPTLVTAPEGLELTCTGEKQALITAGAATGGTLVYSLEENGTYSEAIPKASAVGSYDVWYKIKGDSNHTDTEPAKVTTTISDNTAPVITIKIGNKTWQEFLKLITFGTYSNQTLGVSITATDTGSGVDTVQYYVSHEALSLEDVMAIEDWTTYESDIKLKLADKYVVYAKISDKAGHTTYVSSDGMVIDDVSPAIKGIENGKTYCGTITFTVEEDNYDYVMIDKAKYEQAQESYTITGDGKSHTIYAVDKATNKSVQITITTNASHVWDTPPAFTWAEDHSSATASFPCKNCEETNVVDATLSEEITSKATTARLGSRTVTATAALDGTDYTDSVTLDIPKVTNPSGLTGVDETSYNAADGKITGLTTDMEYRLKGDTEYSPVTGEDMTFAAGTYEVRYMETAQSEASDPVEVTINHALSKITVKADNVTVTYGDAEAELTYQITDGTLIDGNPPVFTVSRKTGTDAGTYDITVSQEEGANPLYDVTFEKGVYTINPKDITGATVTLGDALTENGTEQTQKVDSVVIDGITATYDVTDNTGTKAGTYKMKITGNGNFTGTIEKSFVILPKSEKDSKTDDNGSVKVGDGTFKVVTVISNELPKFTIDTTNAAIFKILTTDKLITSTELSAISDGGEAVLTVTIKDVSSTLSSSYKKDVEKAINGYNPAMYFDISLSLSVDGKTKDVTELSSPLSFTVQLPDKILNTDTTKTRAFNVFRDHYDLIELLSATYSADTKGLTFKSDKFSTYGVAYKDTSKSASGSSGSSSTSGTTTSKTNTGSSVKTGDTAKNNYSGWFLTALISAYVILMIVALSKRTFFKKR